MSALNNNKAFTSSDYLSFSDINLLLDLQLSQSFMTVITITRLKQGYFTLVINSNCIRFVKLGWTGVWVGFFIFLVKQFKSIFEIIIVLHFFNHFFLTEFKLRKNDVLTFFFGWWIFFEVGVNFLKFSNSIFVIVLTKLSKITFWNNFFGWVGAICFAIFK